MKKTLVIILAFILMLSMTSCIDMFYVDDGQNEDVLEFINAVNSLPSPDDITAEHKELIDIAENAYLFLGKSDKKLPDVITKKLLLDQLRISYRIAAELDYIVLSQYNITIAVGQSKKITATVMPETLSDRNFTWNSDDEDIAPISEDGVITGLKDGVAIIRATSSGGFYVTCYVTVDKDYNEFDFDEKECTFYDKFDGNSLDTSKWSYENGSGNNGWGNNEKQYYQPQNLAVSNGLLTITAEVESKNVNNYQTDYTSSKIVTKDKFYQKYGKFEARLRLTEAIQGLWPAFWLMPQNSVYGGWPRSGEIDIMEMRGRVDNEASSALHFGGQSRSSSSRSYTFPDGGKITDFHIYTVEWKPGIFEFSIDGVVYHTVQNSQWFTVPKDSSTPTTDDSPFDQPFYIILNLAVGGDYDGGRVPPSGTLPAALEVDFVRVYAYSA